MNNYSGRNFFLESEGIVACISCCETSFACRSIADIPSKQSLMTEQVDHTDASGMAYSDALGCTCLDSRFLASFGAKRNRMPNATIPTSVATAFTAHSGTMWVDIEWTTLGTTAIGACGGSETRICEEANSGVQWRSSG